MKSRNKRRSRGKREEIRSWTDKKDPEPQREDKVLRVREELNKRGIPHIPFYKVIDFHEGISDEMKGIVGLVHWVMVERL